MIKNIQFVVFDFDGVFTDGKVFINRNGEILKNYNCKDATHLDLLRKKNIPIGVISGYGENDSQMQILNRLKINHIQLGCQDKLKVLQKWCESLGISLSENVAYMGDDINDLEVLKKVALSGCPQDAHSSCKDISNFVATRKGGDGCIMEFVDFLISD